MRTWTLVACFAAVGGLGLSAVTCGGKAVIDPGGAAAAGATGGTGGTTTTPTTSTVTTTSSTMTTTSTTTTTVTTSCDMGDCNTCVNSDCAFNACQDAIDECVMSDPCLALNDCLASCPGDPGCWQQCKQAHPAGVAPLEGLYDCLICGACYIDCDGASGCPYQL